MAMASLCTYHQKEKFNKTNFLCLGVCVCVRVCVCCPVLFMVVHICTIGTYVSLLLLWFFGKRRHICPLCFVWGYKWIKFNNHSNLTCQSTHMSCFFVSATVCPLRTSEWVSGHTLLCSSADETMCVLPFCFFFLLELLVRLHVCCFCCSGSWALSTSCLLDWIIMHVGQFGNSSNTGAYDSEWFCYINREVDENKKITRTQHTRTCNGFLLSPLFNANTFSGMIFF